MQMVSAEHASQVQVVSTEHASQVAAEVVVIEAYFDNLTIIHFVRAKKFTKELTLSSLALNLQFLLILYN